MIHLYIGDGKGKTTAAFGLALRALGWGKKVYVAQFLKDIHYPSGIIKAINVYGLKIKVERFEDQIHPIFLPKDKINRSVIKKSVNKAVSRIEQFIRQKKFDMIILDEILNALDAGFVTESKLSHVIENAQDVELVFTGRLAPQSIVKAADYVSRIKKIKHPFDKNVFARKGIEY